ncbi:MAG: family N-acetyltransferase [Polyangiaceae bacterium]|jgi:GNAT superfamily N-acetyltransferase|nr:family N-acetyltransferase [Polyangiaceae bacterium]
MGDIEIRRLGRDDSLEALTALLHRGYAELGAMGYRYKAVDQSVEVTRNRIAERECYVVVHGGEVVGTALLSPPTLPSSHHPYYDRADVALLSQLAIEPRFQRRGWGSRLMSHLEARAAELNAAEIAVDTSEGAKHLIAIYEGRGYRLITHAQWSHTNFRSVILSKCLSG